MKHASLFSGIGGFDLAAEWMGWENVFNCEIEPFPRKILNYYWPNAISYQDIKETDFKKHYGSIDIISGGFPCQPYSTAGKRQGKEDDRHLWPEMLRAIREIKPRYVLGENVLGLVDWNGGLVFEEVQADLENEGYKVQPIILPACGVDAPHKRYRVWFVAYPNECTARPSRTSRETKSNGGKNDDEQSCRRQSTEQHIGCSNVQRINTNTTNTRIESLRPERENEIHGTRITSDTTGKQGERVQSKQREFSEQKQRELRRSGCKNGSKWNITDPDSLRLRGETDWIRKTRQPNEKSKANDWENFPTQSPICSGNDGISSKLDGITFSKWRRESIKGYGNAIVPQLAYEIFKVIHELNENS